MTDAVQFVYQASKFIYQLDFFFIFILHALDIMSSYTEEERETLCGFGPWRPKFMQILASKKVYMFFYGAIGIIKVIQAADY